jgi:hypothetical protein
MKRIYELQKINLTERPEWSAYDLTEELGERVFQAASEEISALKCEDIVPLSESVLNQGKRSWARFRYLKDEEEEDLCKAFHEVDPAIEVFRQMVIDAFHWTWEFAFMPSDSDLDAALDDAIDEIAILGWFSGSEILFEAANCLNLTEREFTLKALNRLVIFIRHDQGYYDRYLIYDPNTSPLIQALISQPFPCREGVLEWIPDVGEVNEDLVNDLSRYFEDMKEPLIVAFFRHLERKTDNRDVYNRLHFKAQWTNVMKDRKTVMHAKQELEAFLKGRKNA